MDVKEEIREESFCSLDFGAQNEGNLSSREFLKKVKSETVTSDYDIDTKTEIEEAALVSTFCSQNQREFISEDPLMGYHKESKDCIFEPKIEIKEEQCSMETTSTENLCIYDDIEDTAEEDSNCISSPNLYKLDISSYPSDIFSNEHLRNDVSLNLRKDGPDPESSRKYKSQATDVTNILTLNTRGCSETLDEGKIVSMVTCLKQNNLHQQSNKNKKCNAISSSEYRKPHKCSICDKSFKYASHLKKHSIIHDDKKIKCDICEKGFNHLSCLKGHKLIHEGKKPHKCDICDKAFTDLNNLKRHKLIHEGKKPYKCDICENTFTQSQHLNRHKLIHEPTKSYSCDICYKAFTHSSNLKAHKFTHEGKKPYKCDICEKTFSQSAHLKRHKLIHEDIKPYKCDICEKPFTDLSNLKKHKWIHKDKKPHWCNICNKAFTHLHHLKMHKRSHAVKKPH